jgi:3-hydroxyacyl-CoA dehydrogenase/enoyl-CoA hydratase/3-hydroxybutyryl-CoA epimerase
MIADAVIATNTSSLSVSEIAKDISNPSRVVGMHFFNPVEKMPLVEVIHGTQTSDKTIAVTAALAVKLGKYPIVVSDVPGFLVNRVLTPYLNEAALLVNEGYQVADIDRAATRFGLPMGPLRLLDEVGLDVASHVAKIMVQGYGERMTGPGLADKLLSAGRKGKKSSAGFYDYNGKEEKVHPDLSKLLNISAATRNVTDLTLLQDRLVYALLNEAVRCLDEGVAGTPGPEAANQIDLGTVMGMGFPPFRGGVLYYADQLGVPQVLKKLQQFEKEYGPRFTPWSGIVKRSFVGRGFRTAVER